MGTKPIIALLNTGCNTMVVQDRVADEQRLEKRPLDNPYDIDTAGAGQRIRITSFTTQSIQIFNNVLQDYDSVASFHFEIAPIGIPLILGLPFPTNILNSLLVSCHTRQSTVTKYDVQIAAALGGRLDPERVKELRQLQICDEAAREKAASLKRRKAKGKGKATATESESDSSSEYEPYPQKWDDEEDEYNPHGEGPLGGSASGTAGTPGVSYADV
ncbi:hypothetical protein DFJ77DRAFT_515114 [Powellomyces hirtus]|nr:hypothetical protein DFJ77DRAFT_515114 [Powellomyces hirtus]